MSLEDNIKKLEEIVKKIDSQNINIEESLELYEEAINLSKLCLSGVKKYKGKLVALTKELEEITQDGER
ncbi:MAG TPA: exodeoxyribonuclease VII small subunit [Clostridia bacterium]|jgi:exodeoxyribonuclease VII small subunit|nr:exodeoxyribonuclease VII small subunit [Clostridia bacterium]